MTDARGPQGAPGDARERVREPWTEDEERRVRAGARWLVKTPPADGHTWQWTNDNMLGALATIDALRAQRPRAGAPGGLTMFAEKWRWFLKDGEKYHAAFLADVAQLPQAGAPGGCAPTHTPDTGTCEQPAAEHCDYPHDMCRLGHLTTAAPAPVAPPPVAPLDRAQVEPRGEARAEGGEAVGRVDYRAAAISLQSILRRGFQVVHSDPDCIGCEHCGQEWSAHDAGCEIGVVWKFLDGLRRAPTVPPTPERVEPPSGQPARCTGCGHPVTAHDTLSDGETIVCPEPARPGAEG